MSTPNITGSSPMDVAISALIFALLAFLFGKALELAGSDWADAIADSCFLLASYTTAGVIICSLYVFVAGLIVLFWRGR